MSDRCIHQAITNRQVQQGYPEEPSLFFLACIIFITYVFSFSSLQGGFYLIIHYYLLTTTNSMTFTTLNLNDSNKQGFPAGRVEGKQLR